MPGMSASDREAVITTAASAGCGRFRNRPGSSTIITTISAAPVTPVSWLRAPARSATAVREALVLTGKPWKKPAATLAAPMPIISWLPCTSWPRALRRRPRRSRSCRPGTPPRCARPPPRAGRGRTSATVGTVSGGKPLRQHADQAHAVLGQVEDGAGRDREQHHDQDGGDLGQPALQDQDRRRCRRARSPPRPGPTSPSAMPLEEAADLGDQAVGVDREPEQLGQLADQDGQGQPVHVADHRRLGQQVGDEAQLRHSRRRS